MDGVGLVETKTYTFAGAPEGFLLESEARLSPVSVAYETYGELNSDGDNAILICHALTGDAHVAGKHSPHDRIPGWWDEMIGPGRVFDTNRYYVVCSNVLGGCYGTTGPSSINPSTGRRYGMSFPVVTIRDMVRVQWELLRYLKVNRLVSVIGGSMGGMQALEWAVTYPDFMESAIPIATSGRLSAQGIAYNQVQRLAITQDPRWNNGDYYGAGGPDAGLALARMIGTITYKSDPSWTAKFGRTFSGKRSDYFKFDGRFEMENYLLYQGQKLVQRFDANTYLYLTKAMDLHDVGRGYESYEKALLRIRCKVLSVGISSDFLYPTPLQKELVQILRRANRDARYAELESPYGHDAFLIEFEKMSGVLSRFLSTL
ncbi:homoserine acetyltransferase [Clostridiales bacterium PH28_bin88]|nr:homoserine acetyltransferase [Clostridiales bacterium PH28_bin88]